MKNKLGLIFAAGAAICILNPISGQADVKFVQSTTVTNAQFAAMRESMSPQQKAAIHKAGDDYILGIPQISTSYSARKLFRIDSGNTSIIIDSASGTQTTLNRKLRVYGSEPLSDLANRQQGFQVTVTPTRKHGTFLGHAATDYQVSAINISLPGTLIAGDVWTANDIPGPSLPAGSGPMATAAAILRHLHGLPLSMTFKVTGSSAGDTTIHYKVVSLSQTALPVSLFHLPAGYTKGDPNAGNPTLASAGGGGF